MPADSPWLVSQQALSFQRLASVTGHPEHLFASGVGYYQRLPKPQLTLKTA
jgi:hypothetical protein